MAKNDVEDTSRNDGNSPKLPSKDELAGLPRWAMVALAARCARRVQPLFKAAWPQASKNYSDAIEAAISLSEQSAEAGADPKDLNKSQETLNAVHNAARGTADIAKVVAASTHCLRAAIAATSADASAANSALAAVDNSTIIEQVNASAANSVSAINSIVDAQDAGVKCIRQDVERLYFLSKSVQLGDRMRVPPKELGPLWPDGVPKGWPKTDSEDDREIAATNTSTVKATDRKSSEDNETSKVLDPRAAATEEKILDLTEELAELREGKRIDELVQTMEDQIRKQAKRLGELQDEAGKRQDEVQAFLAEQRTKADEARTQYQQAIRLADKHQEHAAKTSSQLLQEQTVAAEAAADKLETHISDQTAAINKLREHEQAKVHVSDPIKYWKRKSLEHYVTFFVTGIVLVLSVWFAIDGLTRFIAYIYTDDALRQVTVSAANPWKLGSAALIGTLILLVLRVMTRITMSNLHLATDARERVVMMQAYLALLQTEVYKLRRDQDGKQINDPDVEGVSAIIENHEALILSALFRPSTTGLVKDDAVPASVLDLATRVASGGGKS